MGIFLSCIILLSLSTILTACEIIPNSVNLNKLPLNEISSDDFFSINKGSIICERKNSNCLGVIEDGYFISKRYLKNIIKVKVSR